MESWDGLSWKELQRSCSHPLPWAGTPWRMDLGQPGSVEGVPAYGNGMGF